MSAQTSTTYHYRQPESQQDKRYDYDYAVLNLALEKTIPSHGNYQLIPTPPMNFPRAVELMRKNLYSNFFIKLSYDQLYTKEFSYSPFPVDLGIVGFRVCFVAPEKKTDVAKVTTLSELQAFRHGQGLGWSDTAILRSYGFDVVEVPSYESLFKMVAQHRFDLFCRGANELMDEYQSRTEIKGLTYDESMAIVYDLPRFFYTHPSNDRALQRVSEGLDMAYQDGSLLQLWQEYYGENIDFVNLEKRRLFRIENPNLEGIDKRYKRYMYDPLKANGINHD